MHLNKRNKVNYTNETFQYTATLAVVVWRVYLTRPFGQTDQLSVITPHQGTSESGAQLVPSRHTPSPMHAQPVTSGRCLHGTLDLYWACGLSVAAQSRKGNLWSVCGCTEQAWQFEVCLWLHRAGVAICGLSEAAQSRKAICGLSSASWRNSNVCVWLFRAEQGYQCLFMAAWRQWSNQ